jgi:ferric-dicitrate binding protein FerR (iron transport regulator)
VWIPAGSRLRVNGSFRVSEPFSLPTAPAVRLAVAPSKRTPGVVLLSVSGGFVFLACIVYAIMTPGRPDEDARSPASLAHRDAEERASRNTAIAFASAGGVGMIAGLIAVIRTPPTQVDPQTSSTAASRGVPLGHGLALSAVGLHF